MDNTHNFKIKSLSYLFLSLLIIIFSFLGLKTVYASASVVNINTAIVSQVSSMSPLYLATDSSGNVYVSGADTGYVKKFDSQGNFLMQIGESGTGDGQFSKPSGIAVDSNGNIFVADMTLNRIQKFNSSGNYVTKWGSAGSGDGQFYNGGSLGGIAIDSTGNVYVVDSYNDRVQKFTNNGVFITKWGTNGSGNDNFYFYSPSDIVIDSSGNVYISDSGNNRIKKYTQNGVYVSQFGSTGSGQGQFSTPTGLSVDPTGNIYVADYDNSRIQVFDSSFNFVEQWGSYGTGSGQFENTNDVLYGPVNNLVYVIDYAVRIQFFDLGSYIPGSSPTPTAASATPVSLTSNDKDCTALPPLTAPNIFNATRQKDKNNNLITLFYTPLNDRVTGYTIVYGTKIGVDEFSVTYSQGYSTGALSYTIGSLKQNQSYSFKIQAINGCATGPWSNYFTVDSKIKRSPKPTITPSPLPTIVPTSVPTSIPQNEELVTTVIEFIDNNSDPLIGAIIDIEQNNQTEVLSVVTNNDGIIEVNLPADDYLATIAINDTEITHPITISTELPFQTIRIDIDEQQKSNIISPIITSTATKATDTVVMAGVGATIAVTTIGAITTSITATSALIPVYQNTARPLVALPYDLAISLIQKLMQSMSSFGITFFGLSFAKWKKRGNVFDTITSKPIKGVFLIFFSKSGNLKTSFTDEFGLYEVNPVPDDYQIKAEKAGYQFPSKLFAVSSNDKYSRIYIPDEIITVEKDNEIVANIAIPLDPKVITNKFLILKNKLINLITHVLSKLHTFFAVFIILIIGIAAYSDPNIFYKIVFAVITTSYLIRFVVKTTNIASRFHVDTTSLA